MKDGQTLEEAGFDRPFLLENILAAVLRKYVPAGRKVTINLASAGHETDIVVDFPCSEGQQVKLSWRDVPDSTT